MVFVVGAPGGALVVSSWVRVLGRLGGLKAVEASPGGSGSPRVPARTGLINGRLRCTLRWPRPRGVPGPAWGSLGGFRFCLACRLRAAWCGAHTLVTGFPPRPPLAFKANGVVKGIRGWGFLGSTPAGAVPYGPRRAKGAVSLSLEGRVLGFSGLRDGPCGLCAHAPSLPCAVKATLCFNLDMHPWLEGSQSRGGYLTGVAYPKPCTPVVCLVLLPEQLPLASARCWPGECLCPAACGEGPG